MSTDRRSRTDDDVGGGAKPMRADARRNRARILEAADAVFAAQGPSASTEDIARLADVAIGTVFRHFPTKQDLVEAVFVDRLRGLTDEARALEGAGDAGEAFFGFFARWAELSATKHAFADALVSDGVDVESAALSGAYPRVRDELLAAVDTLLTRAQEAGQVRDDIGIAELSALLVGAARAAEHTRDDAEVHARTLAIVLDGLRPPRAA